MNPITGRVCSADFSTELKPMPGVIAVLDSLAIPYCVATGSSPLRVTRSLELTGLTSRVKDRVFTTSMVTRGKPAPDIFLHVAREMAVPAQECLVIEDSASGDRGGKGGGNGRLAVYRRLPFPARL